MKAFIYIFMLLIINTASAETIMHAVIKKGFIGTPISEEDYNAFIQHRERTFPSKRYQINDLILWRKPEALMINANRKIEEGMHNMIETVSYLDLISYDPSTRRFKFRLTSNMIGMSTLQTYMKDDHIVISGTVLFDHNKQIVIKGDAKIKNDDWILFVDNSYFDLSILKFNKGLLLFAKRDIPVTIRVH